MIKTIALVTGGGDAPGLNAVIRAVVKTAAGEYGLRVVVLEAVRTPRAHRTHLPALTRGHNARLIAARLTSRL